MIFLSDYHLRLASFPPMSKYIGKILNLFMQKFRISDSKNPRLLEYKKELETLESGVANKSKSLIRKDLAYLIYVTLANSLETSKQLVSTDYRFDINDVDKFVEALNWICKNKSTPLFKQLFPNANQNLESYTDISPIWTMYNEYNNYLNNKRNPVVDSSEVVPFNINILKNKDGITDIGKFGGYHILKFTKFESLLELNTYGKENRGKSESPWNSGWCVARDREAFYSYNKSGYFVFLKLINQSFPLLYACLGEDRGNLDIRRNDDEYFQTKELTPEFCKLVLDTCKANYSKEKIFINNNIMVPIFIYSNDVEYMNWFMENSTTLDKIKYIPGKIDVHKEIIKEAAKGGNLDLNGCTSLKALPENLSVMGNLNLEGCTSLKTLPENLSVSGNLSLWGCTSLKTLPENLSVSGYLYYTNSGITNQEYNRWTNRNRMIPKATKLPIYLSDFHKRTQSTKRKIILSDYHLRIAKTPNAIAEDLFRKPTNGLADYLESNSSIRTYEIFYDMVASGLGYQDYLSQKEFDFFSKYEEDRAANALAIEKRCLDIAKDIIIGYVNKINSELESHNLKGFLQWVIYHCNDTRLPEDLEQIIEVLSQYVIAIKYQKPENKLYSIYYYKRFSSLKEAMKPYLGDIDIAKFLVKPETLNKHLNSPSSHEGHRGATVIYSDSTYKMIKILTPEAAADLCRHAEWCVKDPRWYKNYDINPNDPLYLILKDNYKYCLIHFGSNQVKNTDNDSVSDEMAKELYPLIYKSPISEKFESTIIKRIFKRYDNQDIISDYRPFYDLYRYSPNKEIEEKVFIQGLSFEKNDETFGSTIELPYRIIERVYGDQIVIPEFEKAIEDDVNILLQNKHAHRMLNDNISFIDSAIRQYIYRDFSEEKSKEFEHINRFFNSVRGKMLEIVANGHKYHA